MDWGKHEGKNDVHRKDKSPKSVSMLVLCFQNNHSAFQTTPWNDIEMTSAHSGVTEFQEFSV